MAGSISAQRFSIAVEEFLLLFRTSPAVVKTADKFKIRLPELCQAQRTRIARRNSVEFIGCKVYFVIEITIGTVMDTAVEDLIEFRY